MNLEQALDVLRDADKHVPDTDAAPYDEALRAVREAMFDMAFPDPRDDANKVVRIIHFVEVPRDATIVQALAAFSAGIGQGGIEGSADGVTARFRETRITDPVPESIIIRVPK